MASQPVLPDLLAAGLKVIFCGMAAGNRSAERRSYYADPRNRFWRILYEVGLTDRLLAPSEHDLLLRYGIGLTDLAKHVQGNDRAVPHDALCPERLQTALEEFRPRVLAFNGKRAAQAFLGCKAVQYGPVPLQVGKTNLFVLPSTSGAASRHWSIRPWQELALVLATSW